MLCTVEVLPVTQTLTNLNSLLIEIEVHSGYNLNFKLIPSNTFFLLHVETWVFSEKEQSILFSNISLYISLDQYSVVIWRPTIGKK